MQNALEHILNTCVEHKHQNYNSGNLTMKEYHLKVALWLVDLGYYVFPVRRNKKPYFRFSWNELSTNDKNTVIKYWNHYPDSMVAVDCRKSGIVVIDVDEKPEKKKYGHNILRQCFKNWGNLDFKMPVVISSSGGLHIYAKDCGVKYMTCYEDCIDIRQPHYIIAPYSINEKGGMYKLYNNFCSTDELIPLPENWSNGLQSVKQNKCNVRRNPKTQKQYNKKVRNIDPTILFDKCNFLKKVRDESETLEEPAWFLFASWCSGFTNGREIFHKYSENYPEYDFEESEKKYENASKYHFSCSWAKDVCKKECNNCQLTRKDGK